MPIIKPRNLRNALLSMILLLAVGCQLVTPTPVPTVTPNAGQPTPTPTPLPLGSPGNPVLLGFVHTEDDPEGQAAIEALAAELDAQTGFSVGAVIYPSSREMLDAMRDRIIQAAWLQPLTYLYAKSAGLAQVDLLTNHFGTYYYGVQFLANTDNAFTSYYDPSTNSTIGEAEDALNQFEGLRPCWVEPGSISGYIFPFGLLREKNIENLPGAYVQSHTAVIRSLYIKGICDFGATFSQSGDPRTSSAVLGDLPDADQHVVIIWQTEANIPNLNFSTSIYLDDSIRKSIENTLLDMVKTDEGKATLSKAVGNYDIQDLRIVDDSVYDPLRRAISYAGVDVVDWLGR